MLISKYHFTFDTYCQVNIFKLKTTGEIIREQREVKGLLLRQVAAQLDIDVAILSKIERGERKATREQIAKLADILKLNKDNLLIQYLSEKIAYEIADDDLANEALKVAEERVEYLKAHKKNDERKENSIGFILWLWWAFIRFYRSRLRGAFRY